MFQFHAGTPEIIAMVLGAIAVGTSVFLRFDSLTETLGSLRALREHRARAIIIRVDNERFRFTLGAEGEDDIEGDAEISDVKDAIAKVRARVLDAA